MPKFSTELKEVAINAAKGVATTQFSNADLSSAVRNKMIEELGTDKLDYSTYRRRKHDLFEFIEETIAPIVNDRTSEIFGQFAEYKNIAFGDLNKFIIDDIKLFPVATISLGNGNVKRQRLDSQELVVPMHTVGAGVYEELVRFLAGRTDWAKLTARLAESFVNDIAQRIGDALYKSIDSVGSTYKANVSGTNEELKEKVLEIADHVEASNGQAVIVGTKAALRKLKPEDTSDLQKGAKNEIGYFGVVDGVEAIALPQFHKAGTDEFGLKNEVIFVLPSSDEKLVKVIQDGQYIAREEGGSEGYREDMQMSLDVITRVGVAVITAAKYGAVELA
ncbi:hypothetical protein [Staphylococcus gallinarum]|uniref:hypothetical protein n=1 Tax=Staphylococcus gallinarum TaxID=1293 RepID=UPI0030C48E40